MSCVIKCPFCSRAFRGSEAYLRRAFSQHLIDEHEEELVGKLKELCMNGSCPFSSSEYDDRNKRWLAGIWTTIYMSCDGGNS